MPDPTPTRRLRRWAAGLVLAGAAAGTVGLTAASATPGGAPGAPPAAPPGPTTAALRPDPTTATAARPDPTTATALRADPVSTVPGTTFVRTELYFGTDRPGKDPDVSDTQFARFVARVVTPRFPDGLTQLAGRGQFLSADGTLIREKSFVIILFYPPSDAAANGEIEEIRTLYTKAFDQESVLRADSRDRVSF